RVSFKTSCCCSKWRKKLNSSFPLRQSGFLHEKGENQVTGFLSCLISFWWLLARKLALPSNGFRWTKVLFTDRRRSPILPAAVSSVPIQIKVNYRTARAPIRK